MKVILGIKVKHVLGHISQNHVGIKKKTFFEKNNNYFLTKIMAFLKIKRTST